MKIIYMKKLFILNKNDKKILYIKIIYKIVFNILYLYY